MLQKILDKIIDPSFRKDSGGKLLYFPTHTLGKKGYIVASGEQEQKIRRFIASLFGVQFVLTMMLMIWQGPLGVVVGMVVTVAIMCAAEIQLVKEMQPGNKEGA